MHPRDSRVSLNGSGLLLVNPPWQFDVALGAGYPGSAAGSTSPEHGSTQQRWITHAGT
ncbi:MAG: hypothetical protein U1F06_05360 [Steroidobacteraceae bacterium]